MRRTRKLIVCTLALAAVASQPALAEFPYPTASSNPGDYTQYRLPDGAGRPNDLQGKVEWMYSAKRGLDTDAFAANPIELFGVRGGHVVDRDRQPPDHDTAWEATTGRPDVTIAVLDSGIKWNDAGAMEDLRKKTRLSRGELPIPRHDRPTSLETGEDCSTYRSSYDANRDGVFNIVDYSCDSRVERDPAARVAAGDPAGVGPAGVLDPQDVLIAFTDGGDDDSNGFDDDIVGWDFLDDDNDPFDDVQYGHGTGEARDSTGEANNDGDLATCPNCMSIHMRVGDSFIADVNDFAQATIYAVDNDALVVQEALGTLNNSRLGRQAVEYAYRHGVTVIASAADEAAQHHNWPSSNPHVVLVNSVTKYPTAPPGVPPSYLEFNGCTNFSSKITVAIPSVSCSSDATGRGSGMAGLVYSAALNAIEHGDLDPHPRCRLAGGGPCPVSANEVRQLMASGAVDDVQQSDDVNFASFPGQPEPNCLAPTPACTDPNTNGAQAYANRPIASPPDSRSYPARRGHDQFYGWGRVNMDKAVDSAGGTVEGVAPPEPPAIPPEVEITSPDWFAQVDPAREVLPVGAQIFARGGEYTCRVLVAPGSSPNNADAPAGDFEEVPSEHCDGSTERSAAFEGIVASLDVDELKARFPPNTGDFRQREPGAGTEQSTNGRPNTDPYGFTVKVVATRAADGEELRGEDRRNLFLHRDQDMLESFPIQLTSDGGASPLVVDLDGNNRNELVLGTSDGYVHAYRRDGSELPGWPVRSDRPALHTGGRAFQTGEVSDNLGGAILASTAAADIDHDGAPEVVAADLEGKLYVWSAEGERLLEREAKIEWSGKPLAPFEDVRFDAAAGESKRRRTQHAFLSSPVLADLDRNDGGKLEIVIGGMDRHVYAWNHDGSPVDGFPVLVVDPDKVASVDPQTHAVTFDDAKAGAELNQGAIIDTPAVGNVDGPPDSRPEIVVGTNEEYRANSGNEGPANHEPMSLSLLSAILAPGNSRLYAIKPGGDGDGNLLSGDSPFVDGWPAKVAILITEVLPIVGEGITGSPVISEFSCPSGGAGPKIGSISAVGPGYVFNSNGTSCYGKSGAVDNTLDSDAPPSPTTTDRPAIPAFGQPVFGSLGGVGTTIAIPAAGLIRALDVSVPEYQLGGQDMVGAWIAESPSGEMRPGFPARVNDLQFLNGPVIADIDGLPGDQEELVEGSAHNDLAAYTGAGTPVGTSWPKLTSDWMVTTPLAGSLGTLDVEESAKKTIVAVTRSGSVFAYAVPAQACAPGSWPKFHHDNANSGDARRDAVSPGRPFEVSLSGSELSFRAPGDDLLCGKAAKYELVHSDGEITRRNFESQDALEGAPEPAPAGTRQSFTLPESKRFVAIRAADEQGNVGRPVVIDRQAPGGGLSGGGGAGEGGTSTPQSGDGTGTAGPGCLPRWRLHRRGFGRIKVGRSAARVVSAAGAPRAASPRSLRYCVTGGGRANAGLSRSGDVRLVGTTARGLGARRIGRGSSLRRARSVYGPLRRLRLGVYASSRKGAVVIGARGGRVRYLAVTGRRLRKKPHQLSIYLRRAGLRR